MTGLKKALYAFWSGFGLPAYLSDSVPGNAAYPYITYEAVQGEGITRNILTATSWHLKAPDGDTERTAVMDQIAAAIPEGGVMLPVDGGGFVVLYRNGSNFLSGVRDEDDDTILGGRVSYQINYYL